MTVRIFFFLHSSILYPIDIFTITFLSGNSFPCFGVYADLLSAFNIMPVADPAAG